MKVLLIESNTAIALTITRMLTIRGCLVHWSPHMMDAEEWAARDSCSLILLDAKLALDSKWQAIGVLLKSQPQARVLVVSTLPLADCEPDALSAGAHGFLNLAFDAGELLNHISLMSSDQMANPNRVA